MVLGSDGAAMSKSKGNVVEPRRDGRQRYGADTSAACSCCSPMPPEKDMDWTDAGAEGAYRFLGRAFRFVTRNLDIGVDAPARAEDPAASRAALRKLHQTIRKVTEDFDRRWHFNTSIAALMELINTLHEQEAGLSRAALDQILPSLVLLLGPFAPYMAEELWEQLGRMGPVFRQAWPSYDEALAKEDAAERCIASQRQGSRTHCPVPFGAPQAEARETRAGRSREVAAVRLRQAGRQGDRSTR